MGRIRMTNAADRATVPPTANGGFRKQDSIPRGVVDEFDAAVKLNTNPERDAVNRGVYEKNDTFRVVTDNLAASFPIKPTEKILFKEVKSYNAKFNNRKQNETVLFKEVFKITKIRVYPLDKILLRERIVVGGIERVVYSAS